MVALPAITSVASNALIGALTSKLVDSLIISKINQKQEQNKWLRERKLNLFTQLTEELFCMNCQNLDIQKVKVKEISLKALVLIEDENLKTNIENYLFILDEYECYKNEIKLDELNYELISLLNIHIRA